MSMRRCPDYMYHLGDCGLHLGLQIQASGDWLHHIQHNVPVVAVATPRSQPVLYKLFVAHQV